MATLSPRTIKGSFSLNAREVVAYKNGLSLGQDDRVVVGIYLEDDKDLAIADKRPILRYGEMKELTERIRSYIDNGGVMVLRFLDPTLSLDFVESNFKTAPSNKEHHNYDEKNVRIGITYLHEEVIQGMVQMKEQRVELESSFALLQSFCSQLEKELEKLAPPPKLAWQELPHVSF